MFCFAVRAVMVPEHVWDVQWPPSHIATWAAASMPFSSADIIIVPTEKFLLHFPSACTFTHLPSRLFQIHRQQSLITYFFSKREGSFHWFRPRASPRVHSPVLLYELDSVWYFYPMICFGSLHLHVVPWGIHTQWAPRLAVGVDLVIPLNTSAFVSLSLRIDSYVHTSVEVLRPQLFPMAHFSCHMKAVSPLYLFSVECNYMVFGFAAELQSSPAQDETAVLIPLIRSRKY